MHWRRITSAGADKSTQRRAGFPMVFCALRALAIAAFIWVHGAACDRAFAGEYELTEGDGLAVCEAYRQNLEPRHDAEPMVCKREYDPKIAGFSEVPWRRLDLKEHFDLYREAEINLATNVDGAQGTVMSEQDALAMSRALESKAEHLRVELYVARLPLFGTAHPVNVLSVRELACGPIPKTDVKISRLFVLNSSMTHIDAREQKRLQRWGNNATISIFDGTPYIENYVADDNWGTIFTGSGFLSVATYDRGFRSVCKVTFNPK
jgi:hypothetical protein